MNDADIWSQINEAREYQRQQQQGLGRPIISTVSNGIRYVAVGDKLMWSDRWETVHDFLQYYIQYALGEDFFSDESNKLHSVVQWYDEFDLLKQKHISSDKKVNAAVLNGASRSYLELAYNLYLLHHNEGIQEELIRRLKSSDEINFYGTLYEIHVAANFIKAGFDLEFEDERDGTVSHCEFSATYKKTGRKFSVEAKMHTPKKKNPPIGSTLNKALKKKAKYERIVFIGFSKQLNGEDSVSNDLKIQADKIKKSEKSDIAKEMPPAYVFITNNGAWKNLLGTDFSTGMVLHGFKHPEFNYDYKATIRDLRLERDKNSALYDLNDAIRNYHNIPSTFDGENPVFYKNDIGPPFKIGQTIIVDSKKGKKTVTVNQAVVNKFSSVAIAVCSNGSIIETLLSEEQLQAYEAHPETFFDKLSQRQELKTPLDVYNWLYSNYKNRTKESLLQSFKDSKDIKELEKKSQEDLVEIYCERMAEAMWLDSHKD